MLKDEKAVVVFSGGKIAPPVYFGLSIRFKM